MSDSEGYFATLCRRFGEGWNRFWYTPSDALSLCVLRLGVGCVAWYLVATYAFDLRRFFDPQTGILRLETVTSVLAQTDRMYRFSYLDYARDASTLQVMHYVGLAVLTGFVVGLQTRITSILSLVVFLSYYHRGPMLSDATEPVVSFLLLYLCLGPCGAELSVDAWLRRRRSPQPAPVSTFDATVSLRLIQVHTALVYFLMFCGKMQNSATWWNGTAVWWLAARPESCVVDLRWLHTTPYLVNVWTTVIFLFEPLFALLIWNRTARPLLLGLSVVHWAGIALLTGFFPFALTMFLAGLAFVPADVWRRFIHVRH